MPSCEEKIEDSFSTSSLCFIKASYKRKQQQQAEEDLAFIYSSFLSAYAEPSLLTVFLFEHSPIM